MSELHRVHTELHALRRRVEDLYEQTRQILSNQETIMTTQAEVQAKLTALTADVADETTQIGGVETLLDNLAKQLKVLQDQVANADVPKAIVDQIDALAGAVGQNKARIIDDIKKNTPPA